MDNNTNNVNHRSNKIAIAWFDLTMKVTSFRQTLAASLMKGCGKQSKERVILSGLNGCATFGTLTAVMGPSGAGLTSLLKCLNGLNNSYITHTTQIRVSKDVRIESTFIGQNEKSFLIMGLTARQNMIYASRLKNSLLEKKGQKIDHNSNVAQIMADLLITDTMETKAENCSGGEQKRLAIGLELTALRKPNLILCDEPTTGLDSNVAEVVIECIKSLAVKHKICLMVTIHQPNYDIIQMLDELYVLGKGGHCVYSGPPSGVTTHLAKCRITCTAYQVPIEHLITTASKGVEDSEVEALVSHTNHQIRPEFDRIKSKTKAKQIKPKTKSFSCTDLLLLLRRSVVIIRYYDWKRLLLNLAITAIFASILCIIFPDGIGQPNDCLSLGAPDSRSCFEMLDADTTVEMNIMVLMAVLWFLQVCQVMMTCANFDQKYKTFRDEHQNSWYSSGAYFLSQMIVDFLPTTACAGCVSTITYFMTDQPNEAKRYWAFMLTNLLSFHLVESVGYIFVILIENNQIATLLSFIFCAMGVLFNGFALRIQDMPGLMKFYSHFTTMKFIYTPQLISIYGFDRCSHNMTSKTLFEYNADDDTYYEYLGYATIQLFFYRTLALIALLFVTNKKCHNVIHNYFTKIFTNNNTSRDELELHCYDNSVEININEESAVAPQQCHYLKAEEVDNCCDDDSEECSLISDNESDSSYYTTCDSGSQLFDVNEDNNYELSIGWLDLTLKVEKTFYSKEKLILRGIRGFVRFGTLTALMGPSGAGKTSLLRSLNGMYKTLMTSDSRIFLSKTRKIRTCFIAQDQREHIIGGLTVSQTLLYASKLKNVGLDVDHQTVIRKLMSELRIADIQNKSVNKCSAGQQKRVVMAMELTAKVMPNLICVDEPTSGVDSYSALLMIKCFKTISSKHRLSIITSIHQPNLEMLMHYDLVYVLAKGGLTVFEGRPQQIRRHLSECQIQLTENQIPIEVLMKIAANGYQNEKVIELSEKANADIRRKYNHRMHNELAHYPNGIPIRTKRFSWEQFYHLLVRTVIVTFRYNYLTVSATMATIYAIGVLIRLTYSNIELESFDGCMSVAIDPNQTTDGCVRTEKELVQFTVLNNNMMYLLLTNLLPYCLLLIAQAIQFSIDVKIFLNESRNGWYSCESFILVKSIVDYIPVIPCLFIYLLIVNIHEKDNMFLVMYIQLLISSAATYGLAIILGLCFGKHFLYSFLSYFLLTLCFTSAVAPVYDYPRFIRQLGNPLILADAIKFTLSWYFSNTCTTDQIPILLYKYKYDPEDDTNKTRALLVFNLILHRSLAYLILKFMSKKDVIMVKVKDWADQIKRNVSHHDID